jgi:hypothetical protein
MHLRDIRDSRRQQGRIYRLASMLTMLTLAKEGALPSRIPLPIAVPTAAAQSA